MKLHHIILALLIVGLVGFAPLAGAQVAPNPDNAAGIDLHSGTVVESLVTGLADTTSGNTVQVGPVGGIYEGSVSTYSGQFSAPTGAQAYTGAAVLVDVAYTPAVTDDILEIYDGTSRGTVADVILDIQGGVAKVTMFWRGSRKIDTGIFTYCEDGVFQLGYRVEDQGE